MPELHCLSVLLVWLPYVVLYHTAAWLLTWCRMASGLNSFSNSQWSETSPLAPAGLYEANLPTVTFFLAQGRNLGVHQNIHHHTLQREGQCWDCWDLSTNLPHCWCVSKSLMAWWLHSHWQMTVHRCTLSNIHTNETVKTVYAIMAKRHSNQAVAAMISRLLCSRIVYIKECPTQFQKSKFSMLEQDRNYLTLWWPLYPP